MIFLLSSLMFVVISMLKWSINHNCNLPYKAMNLLHLDISTKCYVFINLFSVFINVYKMAEWQYKDYNQHTAVRTDFLYIIMIYFVHNIGTIWIDAGWKTPMNMEGVKTLLENPFQVLWRWHLGPRKACLLYYSIVYFQL